MIDILSFAHAQHTVEGRMTFTPVLFRLTFCGRPLTSSTQPKGFWETFGFGIFSKSFATLETRGELEPKYLSQLFLGQLLWTRWSAIGQFYPLYHRYTVYLTLGTRGFFSRATGSFVSSAAGRHVFGRRPKTRATKRGSLFKT